MLLDLASAGASGAGFHRWRRQRHRWRDRSDVAARNPGQSGFAGAPITKELHLDTPAVHGCALDDAELGPLRRVGKANRFFVESRPEWRGSEIGYPATGIAGRPDRCLIHPTDAGLTIGVITGVVHQQTSTAFQPGDLQEGPLRQVGQRHGFFVGA